MRLSVCTISFRHHLISISELAAWTRAQGFQGIELWGAHAANLSAEPEYGARWLSSFGLHISMLSDYLPLDGTEHDLRTRVESLSGLARHWGATQLRTFAGRVASGCASRAQRRALVLRLRAACEWAHQHGLLVLVETHPGSLADTTASTELLISEVEHPALGINFDVLHLWEAGDDPADALARLRPHVRHFHLKNVSCRERLGVFAPANVYAAAGSREGMVPLFEGAYDYREFLAGLVLDPSITASLEWFGNDVRGTLRRDRRALEQLARQSSLGVRAGADVLPASG